MWSGFPPELQRELDSIRRLAALTIEDGDVQQNIRTVGGKLQRPLQVGERPISAVQLPEHASAQGPGGCQLRIQSDRSLGAV